MYVRTFAVLSSLIPYILSVVRFMTSVHSMRIARYNTRYRLFFFCTINLSMSRGSVFKMLKYWCLLSRWLSQQRANEKRIYISNYAKQTRNKKHTINDKKMCGESEVIPVYNWRFCSVEHWTKWTKCLNGKR